MPIVKVTELMDRLSGEPGQLENDKVALVRLTNTGAAEGTLLLPRPELDVGVVHLTMRKDLARKLATYLSRGDTSDTLAVILDAFEGASAHQEVIRLRQELAGIRQCAHNLERDVLRNWFRCSTCGVIFTDRALTKAEG